MSRKLQTLRNIGIIAHIDAGKTTVTERMLFYSNFVHKVGMVDQGTTVTDYDPEEQERGITIQAAAVTFDWKDHTFNLIDTPGHVDFTAEVERSLRVLDGGVVVFSAREGVEAQSETVWRQANKYHVPRIAFINKMDREGADFYRTLNQIKNRLGAKPIVVTLPIGAGPPHIPEAFRAIIDLVTMKMLTFSGENGSDIVESDIPKDIEDDAIAWRSQLLDDLSAYSDELTEILFAEAYCCSLCYFCEIVLEWADSFSDPMFPLRKRCRSILEYTSQTLQEFAKRISNSLRSRCLLAITTVAKHTFLP
ncbi:MAG: GTP-binding protein [Planctomycetaceae bacterium]|nr:GTP-binding protein [Planctomycetaceae bacterium]